MSLSKGREVRDDGRGDLGVRFDRLNELRGETGKDPELVEGSGVEDDGCGHLGVRFDVSTGSTHRKLNELRDGKVSESTFNRP